MFALFGIFAQSDGMAFEENLTGKMFLRSAGLSYGGLNTMQALTRNSDVFAAGVANAPVFNHISSVRYCPPLLPAVCGRQGRPCLLVPLSGFLASRRKKTAKKRRKTCQKMGDRRPINKSAGRRPILDG